MVYSMLRVIIDMPKVAAVAAAVLRSSPSLVAASYQHKGVVHRFMFLVTDTPIAHTQEYLKGLLHHRGMAMG